MIKHPDELIKDFIKAMNNCGYNLNENEIEHESQKAPHRPHSLPSRRCAVYIFSLNFDWLAPAGPNRALKVGKAGPNSNARFQSQHYNPHSSRSNLSATLLNSKILWDFIGIESIDDTNVGNWVKQNLDRDNFYMTAENKDLIGELEKYLRGRLGPVFEGG